MAPRARHPSIVSAPLPSHGRAYDYISAAHTLAYPVNYATGAPARRQTMGCCASLVR